MTFSPYNYSKSEVGELKARLAEAIKANCEACDAKIKVLEARLEQTQSIISNLTDDKTAMREQLEDAKARLAEYENVIIPSWKREEEMWRETEARLAEAERLLREMLDSKRADDSPLLLEYWRDRIDAFLRHADEVKHE